MTHRERFRLQLRMGALVLGKRTLVMGVLNVTPDSFSDGAKFFGTKSAVRHALAIQNDGADIINDISGLRNDPHLARVVARHGAALILMHMRGTPRTMQKGPFARDVMLDVISGLRKSIAAAKRSGVPQSQIVIDPGIGFGKSYAQNYELLANLFQLAKLGYPLMVGTSRKGFLGATLAKRGKPAPAEERIWGTAATVAASVLNGAHIVRVHDVAEMSQVARVADEMRRYDPS